MTGEPMHTTSEQKKWCQAYVLSECVSQLSITELAKLYVTNKEH